MGNAVGPPASSDLGRKPTRLGQYLIDAMPAAGYRSRAQLAEAAEMRGSTLSRIIYGDSERPRRENLERLAVALRIDSADLLDLAGYATGNNVTRLHPLHPLAAEFDRYLGPESPLSHERREGLQRVLEHIAEAERAEILRSRRQRA